MAMAIKVDRCVTSISRASLSPTATLQRGLTAQLQYRFISSIKKDEGAATKVDVENRRIDASNFMNKTVVKTAEVSVGNGLMADVMISPSTGIFKQTTIMDEGSQPTYLDMQASTPTGPCVLDSILPVYTGRSGNSHPPIHSYGWETETVIDILRQRIAKLTGGHPMESISTTGATGSNDASVIYVGRFYKSEKYIIALQTEHKCMLDLCQYLQDEGYEITYLPVKSNSLINLKHLEKEIRPTALVSIMMVNNEIKVIQQEEIKKLYRKPDIFHTNGEQAMGEIPGKRNVDWMNIPGAKAFGPKRIGDRYIHCRPKVRIGPLISGGGQEHGLHSGTLAPSLVIGFGEARRTAQEVVEYTRTSEPVFSQHSICSSTMQGDNYIRKGCQNRRPKQFIRTFRTKSHTKADTKEEECRATGRGSMVGVLEANSTEVANNKADKDTDKKERNRKWDTSYSRMTIPEAEKRLGLRLDLRGTSLKEILEGKSGLLAADSMMKVKRKVYQNLVDYIDAGGYPTEADVDFKEANINDIVAATIYPLVAQFKRETKRMLHVSREKEIISKDSSTSGMEEFVVMDYISYDQKKYVLVVEAKKVSLGEARKQCFLSLKDMWDYNGGGTVYGFVTMGDMWRMVSFDGKFQMSEPVLLLFDTMGQNKKRWLKNYSILIDCFNVALSYGGKDLAEVD